MPTLSFAFILAFLIDDKSRKKDYEYQNDMYIFAACIICLQKKRVENNYAISVRAYRARLLLISLRTLKK